jgi:phosphonate transport system permease protein
MLFVLLALLSLPFSDLTIYPVEPWAEFSRMLRGLFQTVAFALLAVVVAAPLGLALAMLFQWRIVRMLCASTRAVHELFWGLIFMQLFGLSPITGLLAILLPYSGVFAKVFAEILEQQSPLPSTTLSTHTGCVSRYLYTWLPQAWPELLSYTRYRFECALRSSTVLGFIGLPTLGFHLETAFKQGQYSEAATMLLLFYALIATIRFWLRPKWLPVYIAAAIWLLPASLPINASFLWQFVSQDIWPVALRHGDWWAAGQWYQQQFVEVAWPAIIDTLLLSQLALVLTGVLALFSYGWASRQLVGAWWCWLGRGGLLVMRSTPELVLAFILLLVFGPSWLPAIIALAIHNGGLIGFLMASHTDQLKLRPDAPKGLNRYLYDTSPRVYPKFMALLFYRWEVILRESAILGILGVTTLGFYIDSAFEDIRFDRAAFLIFLTAMLNLVVDSLSRRVHRYCRLKQVSVGSQRTFLNADR